MHVVYQFLYILAVISAHDYTTVRLKTDGFDFVGLA
jgi:hypothetical protein